MESNIKQLLNNWCSQNKKAPPNYTYTSQGGRGNQRIRFRCEVTVEGFNYTGFGSSTNKKDSQTNAVRDFVNYLVRENIMSGDMVPEFSKNELVGSEEVLITSEYQSYKPPTSSIQLDSGAEGDIQRTNYLTNIFDQKKLEEAEDVDFTADIHGGWTVDNAKSRLHQYMQQYKLHSDYKYSMVGPDHKRSFVCELTLFCPKLKKNIYARESASNKQQASKACALSLVRQMFHLGVIEHSGVATKKQRSDQIPTYKVTTADSVKSQLQSVINKLGLKVPCKLNEGEDTETNLVTNYTIVDFEPQSHHRPQVIAWSPPLMNWNPWNACNIDEGEEAFLPLTEISSRIKITRQQQLNNESLKRCLLEREKLPAFGSRDRIVQAIMSHRIVLVRGETGSGKTTQVPQYILDYFIEEGCGADCNIIVTQPRRISAITLAERVAQERCETLGQSCGYSVRFDTVLPKPYGGILYCTVGSLLRKMEAGLRGVSHVIVDEIHERDCNTDFLMILLKDMSIAYPKMKIILMSATVDVELFRNFFPTIYTVEVEGRTYPVNYYFLEDIIEMLDFKPELVAAKNKKNRNKDDDDDDVEEIMGKNGESSAECDVNCNLICGSDYKPETKIAMGKIPERNINFDLIEAILGYIESIDSDGAVLIFLPGWNIIQLLLKQLSRHPIYGQPRFVILPLHSQVSREDQRRVFQQLKPGSRKIILSTNIAESSVTINDVMFVIDSCRAKVKMFTSRNNMTSYNTVWASKTNLEQRRGRAGRVREGFAFHLCSRARYDRLEIHQTPELLRTALHEIALMIKLLRLGDCKNFLAKAIEQPPIDAIIEAEFLLKEMKAFDKNDELTPLGKILARLPIEPRMGKMIIFGTAFGVGYSCSLIAASTSLGEPFCMPPDRKRLSRVQVNMACGRNSDHVAILNAFHKWENVKHRGEAAEFDFCEQKGLNLSILKMTSEAANQIRSIMINSGFPEEVMYPSNLDFYNEESSQINILLTLLVLGLYPNVCYHKEKRKVFTTEGKSALVHKSSVNCSNFISTFPLPFFIFGEKIRTRAISCKQMSMINPLQLLIFGTRKVTYSENLIVIDDWLTLDIDFDVAALILALRPALEGLLVKVCLNPELTMNPESDDKELMDVVMKLSHPKICTNFDVGSEQMSYSARNTSYATKRSNDFTGNFRGHSYPKYQMMQPRGEYPTQSRYRTQGPREQFSRTPSSWRPSFGNDYQQRPNQYHNPRKAMPTQSSINYPRQSYDQFEQGQYDGYQDYEPSEPDYSNQRYGRNDEYCDPGLSRAYDNQSCDTSSNGSNSSYSQYGMRSPMEPPQMRSPMQPPQMRSSMQPPQMQSSMQPPQMRSSMQPPHMGFQSRPRGNFPRNFDDSSDGNRY